MCLFVGSVEHFRPEGEVAERIAAATALPKAERSSAPGSKMNVSTPSSPRVVKLARGQGSVLKSTGGSKKTSSSRRAPDAKAPCPSFPIDLDAPDYLEPVVTLFRSNLEYRRGISADTPEDHRDIALRDSCQALAFSFRVLWEYESAIVGLREELVLEMDKVLKAKEEAAVRKREVADLQAELGKQVRASRELEGTVRQLQEALDGDEARHQEQVRELTEEVEELHRGKGLDFVALLDSEAFAPHKETLTQAITEGLVLMIKDVYLDLRLDFLEEGYEPPNAGRPQANAGSGPQPDGGSDADDKSDLN